MERLGGMSGILSIDLPKEERSQNLWLPLPAICHRPQKGDYVWVVKGDKVNSVPVKLGEQRMAEYIFQARNGIHIIDFQKTIRRRICKTC